MEGNISIQFRTDGSKSLHVTIGNRNFNFQPHAHARMISHTGRNAGGGSKLCRWNFFIASFSTGKGKIMQEKDYSGQSSTYCTWSSVEQHGYDAEKGGISLLMLTCTREVVHANVSWDTVTAIWARQVDTHSVGMTVMHLSCALINICKGAGGAISWLVRWWNRRVIIFRWH